MPDAFTLTQNYEIDVILPELMVDEMDTDGKGDPLLELLPLSYSDADLIKWDQYENGFGLLSLRGLGGDPDVVGVPGIRQYAVAPGYYGERAIYDETEFTKGREPGSANVPAEPSRRLAILTQYQAAKSVNRIRQTVSDFLLTGKFMNVDKAGRVTHADRIENYRTFSPANDGNTGPGWAASPSTATPLNDLKYWQNQLQIGTSSRFGTDSTLICQSGVVVDLLKTTQIQQTYRSKFGSSIMGLEGVNDLLLGFGLPKLVPYDEGYYPTLADAINRTTANFTRVLPPKSLIWAGTRPKGQKLGKFVLTRNAINNPPVGSGVEPPRRNPLAGKYQWAEGLYILLEYRPKPPSRFELDVGFNGGPVVHFGSASAGVTYT